jgi:uncharacterized protein (DUF433 family)
MTKVAVSLSKKFLEEIDRVVVAEGARSRSEFIRAALRAHVDARASKNGKVGEASVRYAVKKTKAKSKPSFPNIEVVKFTGGLSAVIRGTRTPVRVLVGYLMIGETPEFITQEIVPHITLAQLHEAMRYYFVHQAEIEKERAENTEEASRRYLLEKLGEKKYLEITGGR